MAPATGDNESYYPETQGGVITSRRSVSTSQCLDQRAGQTSLVFSQIIQSTLLDCSNSRVRERRAEWLILRSVCCARPQWFLGTDKCVESVMRTRVWSEARSE